ncbi:hypothetical protein [Wenyingzhuangia sp. IMCC45467]
MNKILLITLFCISYISFSQSPGGVSGSILWLKADAGTNTTTNGVGITSWTDQSGNGFSATGTGDAVYSTANAINGNPVIYFTDDDQPITGTTVVRGEGPNSSTDKSTSFLVQRKSSTTDDCFIEFYEGGSRQFYIDRRYDANEPFFTLPIGVQQIISVSDPGGSGSGANSTIYLNSNNFFTSENLFSTSWENGSYVIGDDSTGGNQLNGEIAEIIYFDYELSNFNRKKVESYLAIKYGITLDNTDGGTDGDYVTSTGIVVWDASVNNTYHNNVIGIGKDNTTLLNQKKSTEFNSDPTLSIDKVSSFSNDLDYIVVGNNQGTLAFGSTGVPSGITNISQRTWKAETNGTPGTISISFTLGSSLTNSGNPSEYALLIDSDTDFTSGATIHSSGVSINGNILTFSGVNIPDASYFTLAYSPVTEFPGNVSTNLNLWLKADTNITATGTDISSWTDGYNSFEFSTVAGAPQYNNTGINYNATVDFDGNDYLTMTDNLDIRTFFIVYNHTSTRNWETPFTNNNVDGVFHGHSDETQVYNNTYTPAATKNGNSYVNGLATDLLTHARPVSTEIHTRELTNNENSSQTYYLGQDRDFTDRAITGQVAEIISYTSTLTDVERDKIESYLAIKYAITLNNSGGLQNGDYIDTNSNILWDASANLSYHNEVIGVGRDDATSLNQLKSSEQNSSTNLTIEKSGSFGNNLDFLLIGNDNGAIGVTSSGTSPVYNQRITRTWKSAVSGSVGGVNISITLPVSSTGNPSDYALLIDSDTDFSNSEIHTTGVSLNGDVVTFTNVQFSDGDIFTLGIGLSFGPANVTNGLTHWFKADEGTSTTTDGVAITQWDNLTGSNNATQAGASDFPTYKENLHNFNPSVYISNGDNGYFNLNLNGINDTDYNIITVVEREITEDENYILGTTASTNNQGLHFGYRSNASLTLAQYGNDIDVTVNNYNDPSVSRALIRGQLDSSNGKIIQELRDGSFSENSHATTSFLTGDNQGVLGKGYGTNGFRGYVSEMIIYSSTISNADLSKIYSYLAIKYGMTLAISDGITNGDYTNSNGTVIWDASENSSFHHDVAGIGYDIASDLIQKQSTSESSDDILSISIDNSVALTNNLNSGSFENNLDYLIWGNNSTESSISLIDNPSSVNACLKQLDRDWKISNIGNVEDVTLQFDLTSFVSRDFNLMIDLDGDGNYSTGTLEIYNTGTIKDDNIVFTDITLPDGCVFTLVDNSSDITYQVGAWVGGAGTSEELDNSTTDLVKSVEIKEDVILSGDANCKCFKISNGAKVTVQSGEILTVTHTLASNGKLFLYDDAQLVQTNSSSTNNGNGTIYQVIDELTPSGYRFNYITLPVNTSGTFSLSENLKFNTDAMDLEVNTDPSFINNDSDGYGTTLSSNWFYTLNSSGTYTKINENTNLAPGVGFTIKGPNQANRYNFIGSPNNGDITALTLVTNNYAIVGNPYPSAIDADTFNSVMLADNITDGTIYFWDQPTGDSHYQDQYDGGYATRINGVGAPAAGVTSATTPTNVIKPGQAFVVAGGTSGGDITFTNSMRLPNTSISGEHFFKVAKMEALKPIIRLGFEFEDEKGTFHRQLVTTPSGGTLEHDQGKDAVMFDYYENDAYWVVKDQEYRYIITSVPVVNDDLKLDLGVVLEKEKEVTFKLDGTESFINDIYLLDNEENIITNIKENNYKVTVAKGDNTQRFSLIFKENASLKTTNVNIENKSVVVTDLNSLSVILEEGIVKNVKLYDLSGRELMSKNNNAATSSLKLSTKAFNKQLVVVKVESDQGVFTQKILLE